VNNMTKAPARQNDQVSNDGHGDGYISTGAATVIFAGQPVACVGDVAKFSDRTAGAIKEGAACVVVHNKRIALIGDSTEKDGIINSGAAAIQVAEGEPFVFMGANVAIGAHVLFGC
jgi:uncharacterized Zn-binding protein involved in type VI secretion